MVHKCDLTIRVMSESDYPYMTKWLNDDLVLEYYGPRLTFEQVVAKYGPRFNNSITRRLAYWNIKVHQLVIYNIMKFQKIN